MDTSSHDKIALLLLWSGLMGACADSTACTSSDDELPSKEILDAGRDMEEQRDTQDLDSGGVDASADMPDHDDVVALPDEVQAEHVWSVVSMCQDLYGGAPDHLTHHDWFVHTQKDDPSKQALTLALKLPLQAGSYPTAVAFVTLDVRTGDELSCRALPVPDAVISHVVHVDPARRVAFYAYHDDELERVGPPSQEGAFVHGVLGVEFDTGRVALDYHEPRLSPLDSPGALALAFERTQLVLNPSANRVVSLDSQAGQVLWTLTGEVPGRPGKPWNISSLSTPSSDTLFLIDRRRDVFELDATGQVTHRYATDEKGWIKGPILMEDAAIFKEVTGERARVMKVLSRQGNTMWFEEPHCQEVFSMSPTSLGCVGFDRQKHEVRVLRMRTDGTQRVERTFRVPESTSLLSYALALSPRHVAVAASSSRDEEDGSSTGLRDVYIVDMERPGSPPVHVEVSGTQNLLGSSLIASGSFSREGVILLSDWGGFHAIQTNIPWTDRGPAPRGPELADHQNSGYLPYTREP